MEVAKSGFFSQTEMSPVELKSAAPEIAENRIRSGFVDFFWERCLLSATIVLCSKLHYTTPILTGVGETLPDATKQDQACRL
jgi:hypothetical protein